MRHGVHQFTTDPPKGLKPDASPHKSPDIDSRLFATPILNIPEVAILGIHHVYFADVNGLSVIQNYAAFQTKLDFLCSLVLITFE